ESIDASKAATQTTPGAIALNSCVSGPTPKGNKLTTITKKKMVESMFVRRRHAKSRSRHTIQRSIDRLEGPFTLRVRGAEYCQLSPLSPDGLRQLQYRRLPGAP